ncbi:YhgE/Pip family protein [Bacillus suaedaesalsae]|uniref:YhgE/Pip domain-containing protein n=1 Tax=Bacillus suaedaesalsae TaxID=2810349 RepID=A0ABS2DLZ8_9BACI|nr:YhgE/Pip domain-containing protein [Bacillus suaedaesalsae]MBM6619508.1 YhgE/Pip domain-containing protein [Bacillus suaedaesalsae]
MNVFQLIASEFSKLAANKAILFSVIGALLVPVIFGGIMLSPDWGPYDNLSNLPVAVVNDDKGATSNGEPMNVGDKLVESLKEKKSLGFEFVSSDEAMEGLEDNEYYLVIVIPEDFSERATTVLSSEPTKLELKYIQNEGLNFLASKVTESATTQIREELANTITATYVATMFTSLEDVADGFKEASDGSTQLAEGTSQLLQGTNELNTSVTSKLVDISKLASGSKDLKAGTGQLLSSLRGKSGDITKLSNGAQELHAGTVRLKNGTAEVMGGLKQAEAGSATLRTAFDTKLKPGSKGVADGALGIQGGVNQLKTGAEKLVAGLEAYKAANPTVLVGPYYGDIQNGADEILAGLTYLSTKSGELAVGAKSVSDGLAGDANTGVVKINEGLKALVAGQSQIVTGASELEAGAKQVAAGNATVRNGWTELTKGASALNSGATQIYDGNKSVDEGWKTLAEGTMKLNEGAAKVDEGTKQLATGLKEGSEKTGGLNLAEENAAMFASPVQLVGSKVNSYEFYRDSTAPYVVTLGLMVGILIMSLFINFTKPQNVSSVSWFVAKFVKLASLSVVQALILSFVVLFGFNLLPNSESLMVESSGGFILFAIFVSVVFSAIVLFLASLGNFGRWVAIAFIVMQLSITGANLPIEMLPEEYRAGSIFLPFTYTIEGFKSVISLNGNMINVGVLSLFFLLFALLALIVFLIRGRGISINKDQQNELSF